MDGRSNKMYRFFEIIPGFLTWTTFVLGLIFSFIKPLWVIYFILVFSVYWFLRILYFVIYLLISWRKAKKAFNTDWLSVLKTKSNWESLYHLVVLPTYKESFEVLDTTFQGLLNSAYPKDKMIIVLSGEERGGVERFQEIINKLRNKYQDKFFKIIFTIHPDGVMGELKAKGANANWAGREAKKLIDQLRIPYEKVVVSYFDCDTAVHKDYFAHLSVVYLEQKDPTRVSYQPVVLYNNNVWDTPMLTRLVSFGTVFWLMTELSRPDRLMTFSSHSMSFKALVDVGYWDKDVVTDDSRIFLQCLVHYQGDYSVMPLYIPVSMDGVLADTYWRTMVNLYLQQRRWAWGIENFPYLMWHFFCQKNNTSFAKKFKFSFLILEGMYSWATVSIILFILGYLPLWMVSQADKALLIVQNAPHVLNFLMTLAMIGLVTSLGVSFFFLPPKPKERSSWMWLVMVGQWFLVPFIFFIFGIPAIDAQTRLMFGKYLGFWVTEKARK